MLAVLLGPWMPSTDVRANLILSMKSPGFPIARVWVTLPDRSVVPRVVRLRPVSRRSRREPVALPMRFEQGRTDPERWSRQLGLCALQGPPRWTRVGNCERVSSVPECTKEEVSG